MEPVEQGAAGVPGAAPIRITLPTVPGQGARWLAEPAGGLLLRLSRQDGRAAPPFRVDGRLQLSWQDPDDRVLAEVEARVLDSDSAGLHVELLDAPPGFAEAVARWAAAASAGVAASAPALPSAQRDRALEAVRRCVRAGLGERCQRLFDLAEAMVSSSSLDRPLEIGGVPVRLATQRLQAVRQAAEAEFLQQVQRPWLSAAAHAAQGSRRAAGLRLVDDEEMQVWLTRSESARLLERDARAAWQLLQPLLRQLGDSVDGLDTDSLGVESLLDALIHALRSVDLEPGLQQHLLRAATRPDILDLTGFYASLRVELQRCGMHEPAAAERPRVPAGWAAAASDTAPARAGVVTADVPPPTAPAAPPAGGPVAHAVASTGAASVPAQRAVDAASRLWALRRELSGAPRSEPSASPVDDALLLDATRRLLDGNASVAHDLADRVRAMATELSGAEVQTSERQEEAIAMLGRLQQAIEVDPLLPAGFRDWSRPLLPPLLGAQLTEQGVSAEGEGIRQLFALLEFGSALVAQRKDAATREIGEQIAGVVERLGASPRLEPVALAGATEQLERLLQRHRRAGAAIEDRVVEACVGQQRLIDARRNVRRELALLFGGRDIPVALAVLLEQRLLPLMVLTVLRHGLDSVAWAGLRNQLLRLDQGLRDAREGSLQEDADALLGWITVLGAEHAADQGQYAPQLAELAAALRGEPVAWQPYREPAEDAAPAAAPADEGELARIGLLNPGDWAAFAVDGGDPRLLKLAWHAPDRRRFVFVSQLGHKAEDLSAAELLDGMRSGRVRLLEEGNASVVERAWRRMLEGLHDELAEQAIHDPLTGLYNRKELDRRLRRWVTAPQRPLLAVMWIGVDHLRVLNQSHGMAAGDYALGQLADVLRLQLARHGDDEGYAARIAGDEFALVLPNCGSAQAEACARAMLAALDALDLHWDGRRFRLQVSIGIGIADENCSASEALLADAERACRAAKESGRGRCYLHQADDFRLSQLRETVDWVGRVEQSLEQGDLVLFGQRALSLSERAKAGPDYLEVLLRMRGREGMSTPENFIVAAERYGQIAAIDRFVLQQLTGLLRMLDTGDSVRIAFNISAHNVVDPDFIDEIIHTLRQQPLPLQRICIELTETAAIQHLAAASAGMQKLSDAGLAMVLDDFGSGWSSYQYLRRLPFDIVKVDGAFIRDIATNPEDLGLARSINEVAHMLGKYTVAEHIENEATLDLVREIGFDYAQGYFIQRPQPITNCLG